MALVVALLVPVVTGRRVPAGSFPLPRVPGASCHCDLHSKCGVCARWRRRCYCDLQTCHVMSHRGHRSDSRSSFHTTHAHTTPTHTTLTPTTHSHTTRLIRSGSSIFHPLASCFSSAYPRFALELQMRGCLVLLSFLLLSLLYVISIYI